MKVLLASFDLFGQVGGGQTYYKNLIARHPQIDFHCLRRDEPKALARPANATAIDCPHFPLPLKWLVDFAPDVPAFAVEAIVAADRIAKAVAGNRYDVVDTPDYQQLAPFLRPAFRRHDVDAGRIALAMHGELSTSIRLNWGKDGSTTPHLAQLEQLQYGAVDLRYGISHFYLDEWRKTSTLESHYLDPLWFFTMPAPTLFRPTTDRPVLRFIGRLERRKGPHLFINLLSWLPRRTYHSAEIIGPDCTATDGLSPAVMLGEMARRRDLPVSIRRALDAKQLAAVFADRTLTVLPSLYDTLNLVTLESLFSGCPTVVSDKAGVCRYLAERFPNVPFTIFNTASFFENAPAIADLLGDYDGHRGRLAAALQNVDIQPRGRGIAEIFRSAPSFDSSCRVVAEQWYDSVMRRLEPARLLLKAASIEAEAPEDSNRSSLKSAA